MTIRPRRTRNPLLAVVLLIVALDVSCEERTEAAPGYAVDPARAMFDGVWLLDGSPGPARTIDGQEPPLLPEAKARYESQLAAVAKGDTSFDHTTWCASAGLPRLLFEPYPFEIIVNRRQVAFLYQWNRWARLVDMTGNQLEPYYSMSFGTGNGRFEGDTLVVETKGIMQETFIDHSRLPHSEELVLTERWRLKEPDVLENRIRIDDPASYAAPWETIVTYRRQPEAGIAEDVCLDRIKQGEPAI